MESSLVIAYLAQDLRLGTFRCLNVCFFLNLLPVSAFTSLFHDPLHIFHTSPWNFLSRRYINQKIWPQVSTKGVQGTSKMEHFLRFASQTMYFFMGLKRVFFVLKEWSHFKLKKSSLFLEDIPLNNVNRFFTAS